MADPLDAGVGAQQPTVSHSHESGMAQCGWFIRPAKASGDELQQGFRKQLKVRWIQVTSAWSWLSRRRLSQTKVSWMSQTKSGARKSDLTPGWWKRVAWMSWGDSSTSTCTRWLTSERPPVKYCARSGWTGRRVAGEKQNRCEAVCDKVPGAPVRWHARHCSTQGHTVEFGDGQIQGAARGGCHFSVLSGANGVRRRTREIKTNSGSWSGRYLVSGLRTGRGRTTMLGQTR